MPYMVGATLALRSIAEGACPVCGCGWLQRQRKIKCASFPWLTLQPYPPPLPGDNLIGDVQSQPQAFDPGSFIVASPVETIKNMGLLFLTDAAAFISHPDDYLWGRLRPALYANRHRFAGRAVLNGVAD